MACLSDVPHAPALMYPASSGLVAPGVRLGFPVAVVPSPSVGFRRGIYWTAARGMCRPAQNRAHGARPLAPAEAGMLGSLSVLQVRDPEMWLTLAGPSGFSLAMRALRWFGV